MTGATCSREFAYYQDPALDGPMPVDEDRDGSLRDAAVREHLGNFRMPDFITEFRFREEALPYDASFSSASFSPYHYAGGVAEDVAVYSFSGWMDGAGYANGAIARFLTLPNPRRHLLLGPWDHGARVNVSPWRDEEAPRFALLGGAAALLRPLPDGPADRARARGAGALFQHPRGALVAPHRPGRRCRPRVA